MQKVFKNDADGKLEFKQLLIYSCEQLEDEERNPGSSLWSKASIEWLENDENLEKLWEWFNSEEYENLCKDWYNNCGVSKEISGLGLWEVDFVAESGSMVISDESRKLEYWLWMVPDWNNYND